MSDELDKSVPIELTHEQSDDVAALGRFITTAFRYLVKHNPPSIRGRAQVLDWQEDLDYICSEEHVESLDRMPPEQIDWLDLDSVARRSLPEFLDIWNAVRRAALVHVENGYSAAEEVVHADRHRAWALAKFLAQKERLVSGWQPQNGLEATLVDMLAQAHFAYCEWLGILTFRCCWQAKELSEEELQWEVPKLSEAQAVEQAMQMVDRFHRLFARTLRQLGDLRRHALPLTIQNAGQVNVAHQQVNIGQVDQ